MVRQIRPADYGLSDDTPVTLHTARLTGRIYPDVLTDEQPNDIRGTGYVRQIGGGRPSGEGYQVFPYRNDAEDEGSVAYLVHRSAITVAATHGARGGRRRGP